MKQTDSEYPSIRGWGCYLCTLAWIAGVRDIAIVDRLFPLLVESGAILDNKVPIKKRNKWYRCFCIEPEYIIEAFAREMGKDIDARELKPRWTKNPEPSRIQPGMYIIKEAAMQNDGSHFGTVYPEVYNPDPRFPLDGPGKTWRLWVAA